MAFIELKLLFANYGNRSGILFNINIPKPDLVTVVQFDPHLEENLPIVIPPGQGKSYEVKLFLTKVSMDTTWTEIFKDKEHWEMEVIFRKSRSLPWNKTVHKKIRISIQELKESAKRVN